MGNRSKYLAVTAAAAGGALVARRRARLRRAAEGIRDSILPTHVGPTAEQDLGIDEAHAPGHQHLVASEADERGPRPLPGRPWRKHGHGMSHPYAGN